MAVFKVRYRIAGGHVRCRLFVADHAGMAYANCGSFTVRKGHEFTDLQQTMYMATFEQDSADTAIILDSPPNHLPRIDSIWAFLSVDEGGEGLCVAPIGPVTAPLIAADQARLDSLKPLARKMAATFGKAIRLVRFTAREEVEAIEP